MVDYYKYLRSKEWLNIRLDLLEYHNFTCQRCFEKKKSRYLHVHHKHYNTLGHESPDDVELICAYCHSKEHGLLNKKPKKKIKIKKNTKAKVKSKKKGFKYVKPKWHNKSLLNKKKNNPRKTMSKSNYLKYKVSLQRGLYTQK